MLEIELKREGKYFGMLMKLSQEIEDRNICLDKLKFTLKDFTGNRNLHEAKNALEILISIDEAGHIKNDNVNVLIALFKLLRLNDLNAIFLEFGFSVEDVKPDKIFSHFRISVICVGNKLNARNISNIVGMFNVPKEKCTNQWKLLHYLEDERKLNKDNLLDFMKDAQINTDYLQLHPADSPDSLHSTSPDTPQWNPADSLHSTPPDSPDSLHSTPPAFSNDLQSTSPPDTPRWNPAENTVPLEIFDQGFETVKAFNEALKEGEAEVNQGRLIVMGLERVGKTSTIKSFLKKEFNPKEPYTDGIAENKIYIQESPDVWKEAPKDMCPFIFTYNKEASALFEKKVKEQKVLKQEQPSTSSTSSSSPSKEEIPEGIVSEAQTFATYEAPSDLEIPENAFIMNIWDFGGQPIYSVIQRMLFASFAVVCVVFNFEHDLNRRARVRDPTTGEFYEHRMTYLDFIICCIRSVYMNGNHFELDGILGPPILLLGTHCNSLKLGLTKAKRKSKIEKISNEIWGALRNKPYGKMVFSEIFAIENSESFDRSGAADIMKEIFTLTKKMIKPLPFKWMLVLKGIQTLRKKNFYQYTNEIIKLMEQCGIKQVDQHVVLQYLHDIGEIFYNPNDDIIVIDIMQVVRLSTAIITIIKPKFQASMFRDSWKRLNTGILEKRLLIHVWKKLGVKGELVDFFASLLQRFGLMCKKEVTEGQECVYYVLSRLKPLPKDPLPYDENRAISLFHDFSNYLPDHIFQRGATKFIERFQMNNDYPSLHYEQVGLNIDIKHYVILNVETYKHRRMFKTTIVRIGDINTPEYVDPEPSVCKKVLNFLQGELKQLCPSNELGVELKTYIPCTLCKDFHIVSDFNSDTLLCVMGRPNIKRYHWLFGDGPRPTSIDHTDDGQGDGAGRGEEANLLGHTEPHREVPDENRNNFSQLYNFLCENQCCQKCLIGAVVSIFFTLIGFWALSIYYSVKNSDNWPYTIITTTLGLSSLCVLIFNKKIRTEIKKCFNISNSETEREPRQSIHLHIHSNT